MTNEESRLVVFGLIFTAVMINVAAQLLLKVGMQRIGYFDFAPGNIVPVGWRVATSIPIVISIFCYVMSVVVWMMVLSRTDVSLAYPMASMGYVLVAIAAYFLFGENVTPQRMLGIFVIIFGVYLLSRTA